LRYPHTPNEAKWTVKDEKNRVSFQIITQNNNKNVIFIGFDGQFASKDLKNHQKKKRT
jgi:hypothetical protein